MKSFLQSHEWEEVQSRSGRKTYRVAGALVIKRQLPLGLSYLYSPRPTIEHPGLFLKEVAECARREKSIFLKIDPLEQTYDIPDGIISHSIQPRMTIVNDLQKTEEELLAAMHEKTRYNIRLAERKGVIVTNETNNDVARSVFWQLLTLTAERDVFGIHPRAYYDMVGSVRSPGFSNELFFARFRGEVCAAALINFYRPLETLGGTVTYLHGASGREHRGAMAPHLLHWRIMQEAKRRGFHRYDWWGIDETRWPGVTRFKRGFGGIEYVHPQSKDFIYRPWAYRWYRGTRRIQQFFHQRFP